MQTVWNIQQIEDIAPDCLLRNSGKPMPNLGAQIIVSAIQDFLGARGKQDFYSADAFLYSRAPSMVRHFAMITDMANAGSSRPRNWRTMLDDRRERWLLQRAENLARAKKRAARAA